MNDLSNTTPTDTLEWISFSASDVGYLRKVNEDSFLDAREHGLWVVADGMGGHSRGDRASQLIIENLVSFESTEDLETSVLELRERLYEANRACRSLGHGKVMGSTVAAMYVHGSECFLYWAGDSRIYLLRDGHMNQLTEDHSLVQELCRLGELTPEEAENHPSSNVITRAIGVHDKLDLDIHRLEVRPGDRFLLCSDGMFKDVAPHEVSKKLALPSAEQALQELVKQALDRGGSDNVTAIVVQACYQNHEDNSVSSGI